MNSLFTTFLRNQELLPVDRAAVPLDNIAYAYGFGVYETIRVVRGVPYFLPQHARRLLRSAEILDLAHTFTSSSIEEGVKKLIRHNNIETANIKLLLVGGKMAADATLYGFCSSPRFPKRSWYRTGVPVVVVPGERLFPQAKTLNMLTSYLAYRQAAVVGAYDALLVDRDGHINEGTRSNVFGISGRTLVSPPSSNILSGVTRQVLLEVAKNAGFAYRESTFTQEELLNFDGCFLTSTSTKVMPISSVAGKDIPVPNELHELMRAFDDFYDNCQGVFSAE